MSDLLRRAADRIRRWRESPATMVREEFGDEPDEWQHELFQAFANRDDPQKQRIAMKASKGPGKTYGLAVCGLNFLACHGDEKEHPKGVCTSITKKNLDDNLWTEFAKLMRRSKFFSAAFTWTRERIFANDHPETWWLSKRTWSQDADQQQQSETLAGLHGRYLLYLCDETGGYPSSIMATAEAGLATAGVGNRFQKIVQGGNPTHLTGPLYEACKRNRASWYLITINGDPDSPHRAKRVDVNWARKQIELYGRENPWVQVNVFGEFPAASLNALLGPDEVERAMKRKHRDEDFRWAQKRLGVDVARFGDDRSVLFPRQGLQAFRPVTMRGERTTAIAARVMLTKRRWNPEIITVDDSGHWGHGVIDNLYAANVPNVLPIIFSDPAIDKRYKNRRVEMWLEMAEWVKRGGALPFIPELVPELTEPTYWFQNGVFVLEDKDQIKERLGYSPDLADALALTFALPEMPGQLTDDDGVPFGIRKELEQGGGHHWEYDPLEAGR